MTLYDLPIFPLNTVLFPGMPVKLHIFEERYKIMISRCYQKAQPFGIVFIKSGSEVGADADPFSVGCSARITELEPLTEGRYNLVAIGQDRFRMLSLNHDLPYLTASVESFPFTTSDVQEAQQQASILRSWVKKYLHILSQTTDAQLDIQHLPVDPVRLACLATFLINIPNAQKQDLLNQESAHELLNRLRVLYRREATLLDAMLRPQEPDEPEPFSSN
jgi:Lon protease-like protein